MTSTQFDSYAQASDGIIPLCVPEIRGNEWKYIAECLNTNWVSSVGSFVNRFEQMVADYLGVGYAVATVNGTAALHVALLVAGVRADDEVLVPAITFVAPANAVRYVGAWPTFMDADPTYWQMDPEKTVGFLKKECRWRNGSLHNKATGRRITAILPVHILGHPVDMDPILEIAKTYELIVIEDAAESLGAKYLRHHVSKNAEWSRVGSLADVGCLSFNGNKIITTGGGGMIVTNNEAWAHKAKYLATQAKDDPVEYVHNEIGYNYRLTNIQAAMGVAQMELLEDYVAAKLRIASRYREGLAGLPGISLPGEADWAESIFWLYTILVDQDSYGSDSRDLLTKLRSACIESRSFWRPLYTLAPFKDCFAYRIETANRLYRDGLSLPSSVGLGEKEQDLVIEVVRRLAKT